MKKTVAPVVFSIPQNINHEKNVFRGVQIEVRIENGLPEGRRLSHFDGDETLSGDLQACGVGWDVGTRVNAPHFALFFFHHLLLFFLFFWNIGWAIVFS